MSFKNFLDLRKKAEVKTEIIERVVFLKRSLKKDLFLTLAVILTASLVVWGISKADSLISTPPQLEQTESFDTYGFVANASNGTLVVDPALGPDGMANHSYSIAVDSATKIQTKTFDAITLSDLQPGDKIIVQGTSLGNKLTATQIYSFASRFPETKGVYGVLIPDYGIFASTTPTTATTTEEASTTEASSSSTSTENATTTPSIIDTIKDAVVNFVDKIIGNSTSTATSSMDTSATTTVTSTNSDESTTTSSSSILEGTSTLFDKITDTVKDTIGKIMGGSSSSTSDEKPADVAPVSTDSSASGIPVNPTTQ